MDLKIIKYHLKTLKVYHHLLIIGIAVLFYFLLNWLLSIWVTIDHSYDLFFVKTLSGFLGLLVGFFAVIYFKDVWVEMKGELNQIKQVNQTKDLIYKRDKEIYQQIKKSLKIRTDSSFKNAMFWRFATRREIEISVDKFDDNDKDILESTISPYNLSYTYKKNTIKIYLNAWKQTIE